MSGLARRVDALEAFAEEARLRNVEQAQTKRARLRADGLTDEQIDARTAADIGITVDELRRRADALVERFS